MAILKKALIIIPILFLLSCNNPQQQKFIDNNTKPTKIVVKNEKPIISNEILDKFYSLNKRNTIEYNKKQIYLDLYKMRADINNEKEYTVYIVIIKTDEKEYARMSVNEFEPQAGFRYVVPKTKVPLFYITDYLGGNGWDRSPEEIFLLTDNMFLKHIGSVDMIYDANKDGIDELLGIDDTFELVYPFGHVNSPGVYKFMKIENDKIVADYFNDYYAKELERINKKIKEYSHEIPKKDDMHELLHSILEKLLIYRLQGNIEQGWKEFDKDMQFYNPEYFWIGSEKIKITKLKEMYRDIIRKYDKYFGR